MSRSLRNGPAVAAAAFAVIAAGSCAAHRPPSPAAMPELPLKPGTVVPAVNQTLTPYGTLVTLPGMRPLGLALSPDGRLLVVSGKTNEIVILDPATGRIRYGIPLPNEAQLEPAPEIASMNILEPDTEAEIAYAGLVFSPDGRRIFLSNVNGSIKAFEVGHRDVIRPSHSIPLPPTDAPRRKEEIPAGLAVSADGRLLYVCGNLSDRLLEIDLETRAVRRTFGVGVAPFHVVLRGTKAYVSNWGGRRPGPGDPVGPAGRGTFVIVDPATGIAGQGSVSVVDLAAGRTVKEIPARLHASALALSPDGKFLVCANAASDNLSVIDTSTDEVVETIWTKADPAELLGASPNALCFAPDGRRLYVANGTQNAVAVVDFAPGGGSGGGSRLLGMIPAGWFPAVLAYDAGRNRLLVANLKGLPAERQKAPATRGYGFNSLEYAGSLSIMPPPPDEELARLAAAVDANRRRPAIEDALSPPRPGVSPRPVPERIGEPSVFKHVVYVIKENRTYDQMLGDVAEGRGEPSLCIFGEDVTPNQHKLVREFALLDNAYCSGILSADGHQWSTTAFGTDYLEKSFAGWPRSYPDGMGPDEADALAYAPSGFLWDNARRHGVSMANFGEFAMPRCGWADRSREGQPAWKDYYDEFLNGGGRVVVGSEPTIETIRPFTETRTVGWNMDVPDVWRARYIAGKVAEWEASGTMPSLVFVCLPCDHTTGTKEGYPTPEAMVADNDLAFGRIVESLSRSRFWPETVVFGIEDDPQAGFDHVSGYRTTLYCASPYTKRGAVVHTLYNTISLVRTIEQILGLPPMNQFDASAAPMFDCFTDAPNLAPFTAVANVIPLDRMNPPAKAVADARLREDARVSATLDFSRVDACPEDVLNRILWRAVKGTKVPYPEWAAPKVAPRDDD